MTRRQAILAASAPFLFFRRSNAAERPTIHEDGVVHAASFERGAPLAPGGIASLFGEHLLEQEYSARSVPLASRVGGLEVLVGGVAAPLFYAGPGQVNFQVPWEAPLGKVPVRVVRDGVESNTEEVEIRERAPGLFFYHNRLAAAFAYNPGGEVVVQGLGEPGAPVMVGGVLELYATGFGRGSELIPSGHAAPVQPLSWLEPPEVWLRWRNLDGYVLEERLEVLAALEAPSLVGCDQLNVRIPAETRYGPLSTGVYSIIARLPGGVESKPVDVAILNTSNGVRPDYVGISFRDTDNLDEENRRPRPFRAAPIVLKNLATGETNTQRPSTYGNALFRIPASKHERSEASLELSLRDPRYYKWTRVFLYERSKRYGPVNILERFSDPDNIDPRTGEPLDSLDHCYRMNGNGTLKRVFGIDLVDGWCDRRVPHYFINPEEWPPGFIDEVKESSRVMESWLGFKPGQLFLFVEGNPWKEGRPGIYFSFRPDLPHSAAGVAEYDINGFIRASISFPAPLDWLALSYLLPHEEAHTRGFGIGPYSHSEFPNHIMHSPIYVNGPLEKRKGGFEARCYARIISMKDGARALEVLWDEYAK